MRRLLTKKDRAEYRAATIKLLTDDGATVQNVYDLVVVLYDHKFKNGVLPCLKIWKQNGAHAFVNYCYKTEARRQESLDGYVGSAEKRVVGKAKKQRENKDAVCNSDLKVGDIFESSWGYDQTNVDFYEIVKVKGFFAWLQQIGTKRVGDCGNSMACYVEPDRSRRVGEIYRHKIIGHAYSGKWSVCFKVSSCSHAYRWHGKRSYQSWYA